jgi:hypothetical protein
VVERGPEKAGVGGSIPSLATIYICSPAEAACRQFIAGKCRRTVQTACSSCLSLQRVSFAADIKQTL